MDRLKTDMIWRRYGSRVLNVERSAWDHTVAWGLLWMIGILHLMHENIFRYCPCQGISPGPWYWPPSKLGRKKTVLGFSHWFLVDWSLLIDVRFHLYDKSNPAAQVRLKTDMIWRRYGSRVLNVERPAWDHTAAWGQLCMIEILQFMYENISRYFPKYGISPRPSGWPPSKLSRKKSLLGLSH